MRRLALVATVFLLGCGGGPKDERPHQVKKAVEREHSEARKDLKRVRESSLPKEAKKELEEAQKLLDDASK